MLCHTGVGMGRGAHFGDKSSMAGSTSNHSSVTVITGQDALAAGFINAVPAGQLSHWWLNYDTTAAATQSKLNQKQETLAAQFLRDDKRVTCWMLEWRYVTHCLTGVALRWWCIHSAGLIAENDISGWLKQLSQEPISALRFKLGLWHSWLEVKVNDSVLYVLSYTTCYINYSTKKVQKWEWKDTSCILFLKYRLHCKTLFQSK